MTEADYKTALDAFKKQKNCTREEARDRLRKIGILDKNNNVRRAYKGIIVDKTITKGDKHI